MPVIREVREGDYDRWIPLWEGYNAFYGRSGETALPHEVTKTTWLRFFDPSNAVARSLYDKVAERSGFLVYRKVL